MKLVMAVNAAGRVRPCKNLTNSKSSKLGTHINSKQLKLSIIIAMRSIFKGFCLAKNKPYTNGAIASGSMVAVIRLPATAGDTLYSLANKFNNG